MAVISPGHDTITEICRALGIDPKAQPIRKIVIEADYESVTQVYIVRLLEQEEQTGICAALAKAHQVGTVKVREVADVQVSDKAEVAAMTPEDAASLIVKEVPKSKMKSVFGLIAEQAGFADLAQPHREDCTHEFDSSRTCNYCGVAAEKVPGNADNAFCAVRYNTRSPR